MGIVTSCERRTISLFDPSESTFPCFNRVDPAFKLLGEQPEKWKGLADISNTNTFLRNPYEKDAERDYLAHQIRDTTDVATLPPNRFPVPADVELPIDYPLWLANFINKKEGMRLKLGVASLSMPDEYISKVAEVAYLLKTLHYLKFTYMHEVDSARPRFLLWEVHKGRRERCLCVHRRRRLYPRIVIMKRTETFNIIGKGFMLRLFPVPERADPDQYCADRNNGELPISLGTYTRTLDTVPAMSIEWNVRLWAWENNQP
ncbi:uncharacterized protein LOC117323718 [Pecten maximus]|uniref:uncharacterized protein LOC117323718 n=1 Tax=Pecten maximus TaxID=6579 RepID=UPI001457F74D|nr:uncharacterized protein LOC117323718 [Pecten maximus]